MVSNQESTQVSQLRTRTIMQNQAENLLAAANGTPLPPVMAEKTGDAVRGDIKLTTNVYGVMMPDSIVYRYDVTMSGAILKRDGTEALFDLTKKFKGDAVTVEHRQMCRDMFVVLKKQNLDFFKGGDKCVYYDLQSILFSLVSLDISSSGANDFCIEESYLPPSCSNYSRCYIKILKVKGDGHELQLGAFGQVGRDLNMAEHSLAQFIDIATSQATFFSEEHITFSTSSSYLIVNQALFGFSPDVLNFPEISAYLAYGARKAVRFIEGPKAGGCAASLVVETKKTAFHDVDRLDLKALHLTKSFNNLAVGDISKLNKFLKGLYVETSHTKRRQRFFIKSISEDTAQTKIIKINEEEMSVEEYFLKTYALQLNSPHAPLVETAGRDGTRFFPMELCMVCDNQRVKTEQQTPSMTQSTIKKCAVSPYILREENNNTAASLHLWDSEYLNEAKLKIVQKPVTVCARNIFPPEMETGDGQSSRVDSSRFSWNLRGSFFAPANCKVWAAYAFLDGGDRNKLKLGDFEEFLQRFCTEANSHGLRLSPPADYQILDSRSQTICETFAYASKHNCEFVFVVHSDFGDDAHGDIKYAERKFSLISQAVRLITLNNVLNKNQRLTLSNIVNKTNVKLGGLNYTIAKNSLNSKYVLGNDTLYIGLGLNHPGGGMGISTSSENSKVEQQSISMDSIVDSPPSIVGFAANVGPNNPFDFVGDFIFQEPLRDEKVDIINEIIERCIFLFQKTRNSLPKRVIIFRNGCSEGAFKNVIMYEVPLIKIALKNMGCTNPLLTIIVANKLQSVRFFNQDINPNDRAPEQNIRPGTVVDHTVVHPKFAEFFLNSHRAIQGTSRTPKYSILYDDSKMTLSQVEAITYQLCYGHQIIFSPVSLPSPIYIANRYAERGRRLYQRFILHEGARDITYRDLTKELAYYGDEHLFGIRVNA